MRIGLGYDVHPLRQGRELILGGVTVPYDRGLDGHSDADALVHSVCDAILGAMGVGDLGTHFPSTDPRFKDMSSLLMLKEVAQLLAQRGFRLVNLDCVILAESPKLGPYLRDMERRMAEVVDVDAGLVNVKVKSGEGLGMIGRGEGIAAQAMCLIDS